jgi:hypothetical protein
MTGTVKTDVAAISPTANAKAVAASRGVDLSGLMTLLQTHAVEMQILIKEIIKIHPSGGGDAANLTALNSILSELL